MRSQRAARSLPQHRSQLAARPRGGKARALAHQRCAPLCDRLAQMDVEDEFGGPSDEPVRHLVGTPLTPDAEERRREGGGAAIVGAAAGGEAAAGASDAGAVQPPPPAAQAAALPVWTGGRVGTPASVEDQLYRDPATGRKGRCVAERSFNQETGAAKGSKHRLRYVCDTCDDLLPQKAPATQRLCKGCSGASIAPPAAAAATAAPPPLPQDEGDLQFTAAAIALSTLPTGEQAAPPTGEDWVEGSPFEFQGGSHEKKALLRHLEASTHHRLKTNDRILDSRALASAAAGTHGSVPHDRSGSVVPNQDPNSAARRQYEQVRDERTACLLRSQQRIASLPFTSQRVQRDDVLLDCYDKLVLVDGNFGYFDEMLDGGVLGYARLRLDENRARAELAAEPPASDEEREALKRTLARVCDYDALLERVLELVNSPPPSIMTAAAQPASGAVDPGVVIDPDSDDIGTSFTIAIYTDFSLATRLCAYPQRATAAVEQCKATRKQHAALFAALDVAAFANRISRWLKNPFESKLVLWARSSGGRQVRVDSDDSVELLHDLTAVAKQLARAVCKLRRAFEDAEFNHYNSFMRARAPTWWQCDGVPSLAALKRLLKEMPAVRAQALANRMDDEALTGQVAEPNFSEEEKEQLRAALIASAAPTLVPLVWKALHAHATRLLTSSPAVRLCGMHDVAALVIESLASPDAAHVAALLAAARELGGHGSAKHVRLDPKALYDEVKPHTLSRGLKRKAALVTDLRGERHSTPLDDGANRLPHVAEWDNARCSSAAVVWCLKAASEIHAMETDRYHDPLFHLLPFLDGVPARGDPERCRAALLQQAGPLRIAKTSDRSLPAYRLQVEKAARRLFDATAGIKKTKRQYEIPVAELQRLTPRA